MATFVDTNVVVFAHDHGGGAKREIAQRLLLESEDLVVSTQVLAEFYWVVTRHLRPEVSPEQAWRATRQLGSLPVVATDANLVLEAIETSQRNRLALWDALIVEAAVRGACERILTEDLSHGQTIRGVAIVDPFR
ncbi:MAG: PIN domain-containing protein [Acidimicrobiia bacterium]